jgi:hypothetical protein
MYAHTHSHVSHALTQGLARAAERAEEEEAAALVRGVWSKVARDVELFRFHHTRMLLNRCV